MNAYMFRIPKTQGPSGFKGRRVLGEEKEMVMTHSYDCLFVYFIA